MTETLTGVIGIAVFVVLIVLNARRRARLTPEQRQLEDMQRDIRSIKREQRRQRWN